MSGRGDKLISIGLLGDGRHAVFEQGWLVHDVVDGIGDRRPQAGLCWLVTTSKQGMKCVKCGKRKGKRGCPALGGDICSDCCGTHRLKEIACPPTCSWLGGLAVVAGLSEPPPQDVRAAIKEVCASIGPWLRTVLRLQHGPALHFAFREKHIS